MGQQGDGEPLLQVADLSLEAGQFFVGQLLHGQIAPMLPQQDAGLLLFQLEFAEPLVVVYQRFQPGPLPGDRLHLSGISRHVGIGQLALKALEGAPCRFQSLVQQGVIHGGGVRTAACGGMNGSTRMVQHNRSSTQPELKPNKKAGCSGASGWR